VSDLPPSHVPNPAVVAAPANGLRSLTRVSWPAIFAGVILALAIEMLLDLLGAGIGLGVVNPAAGGAPSNFGFAAGLWWLGATIIALFFSGYVAARLAGVISRFDGMLHGLVIWALGLLITVYLVTTAVGGVIGGAFSVIGSTASAVGQEIKAATPQLSSPSGLSPEALQEQARTLLQPPNQTPATMSREDATREIVRLLPDLTAGGDRANQAKQRMIDIITAQANISRDEAARRFDQAQAQFTQIKNQAAQTAKSAAAQGASAGAWVTLGAFVVSLIGLIAAALGGATASPQPPPFLARWAERYARF